MGHILVSSCTKQGNGIENLDPQLKPGMFANQAIVLDNEFPT